MPASVAMPAGLQLFRLGDVGNLAQSRQRVILAHDGDHRTALARFAHHGGRNAADILGNPEALLFQHLPVFLDGAVFGVADLGHAPDPVRETDEFLTVLIDKIPDQLGIRHGVLSWTHFLDRMQARKGGKFRRDSARVTWKDANDAPGPRPGQVRRTPAESVFQISCSLFVLFMIKTVPVGLGDIIAGGT